MSMLAEKFETKETTYFAEPELHDFFFTEELKAVVGRLREALPKEIAISLYSDATLKTNRLPTGIVCRAQSRNAILLPFILRDPGCGFLMFKISTPQLSSLWQEKVGILLNNLQQLQRLNQYKNEILTNYGLSNILQKGLAGFNDLNTNSFRHVNFPTNIDQVLTSQEIRFLEKDFMSLTNTIEIRKIITVNDNKLLQHQGINPRDFIGFIHTGSHAFPKILGERFVPKICQYAHQTGLFSIDEISQGILGVPLNSELGHEYKNWLQAAMNYALVSRYGMYLVIKKILERVIDGEVTLLDDNIHAGLFTDSLSDETYITRGVQHISSDRLTLLAGQRETAAALIVGTRDKNTTELVGHGTGYIIKNNFDYDATFQRECIEQQLAHAKNTFYNTTPNFSETIPYTFNLQRSLEFYQQYGLARTVALLSPFINIQSRGSYDVEK